MPDTRLHEFLDTHHVHYVTVKHSPAYTAQEIAARSHTPGQELAKSVIVMIDGRMVMVVLPASYRINFTRLKEVTGAQSAELAGEAEFAERFPDCQLGAMPPFGNLYGMPVLVDESLAAGAEIAFNACNHHELVRLSFADFKALVQPQVVSFTWQPYMANHLTG